MELADGGSLANYLKNNLAKLTIKKKLQILIDVAHGLNYLHDKNIIHNDLRKENVLVARGVAKLNDFGLSLNMNTPIHASEMNSSNVHITKQNKFFSDIHGFGTILCDIFVEKKLKNP